MVLLCWAVAWCWLKECWEEVDGGGAGPPTQLWPGYKANTRVSETVNSSRIFNKDCILNSTSKVYSLHQNIVQTKTYVRQTHI